MNLRSFLIPLIVLVLGVLASVAASVFTSSGWETRQRLRFEQSVQASQDALVARIETYTALLRGVAGLAASGEGITKAEFHRYVDRLGLSDHYKGAQGLGYAAVFPRGELSAIEQRMQQEGVAFKFRSASPDRDTLSAIFYIAPENARNLAAIGFDMAGEVVRREAMERARDTGLPVLSGKVTLVQEINADRQNGFLIYYPIYRSGKIPATVEQRRQELYAYAYCPVRAGDFLESIIDTPIQEHVQFKIYDGDVSDSSILSSHNAVPLSTYEPRFTTQRSVDVANRRWSIVFQDSPSFPTLSNGNPRWSILGLGFAISILLFALTASISRAREAAVQELKEREARERLLAEMNETLEHRVEERTKALATSVEELESFSYTVAHDLRAPLRAMSGFAALLRKEHAEALDQEGVLFLNRIEANATRMSHLIDGLLDLTRISRTPLQHTRIDVTALAADVARHQMEEHPQVKIRVEDGLSAMGDERLVRTVIQNLVDNAVKFSLPCSAPEVHIGCMDKHLFVRDNGVGFDMQHRAKLFGTFERLHSPGEFDGMGIGLASAKRIIDRHGGKIWAESSPGNGATFFFTFSA